MTSRTAEPSCAACPTHVLPHPRGRVGHLGGTAKRAGLFIIALARIPVRPLLSEGEGRMGRMTVTGRLELVAFDAPDIERLASFYVELTGWQIVREASEWITLRAPDGQEIAFQLAPDHVPPQWPGQEHPQQFHLDLTIDDTAAAAERAVSLGATRLADGSSWITMADPAGHPFDLCQRDGVGPVMGLFAVTIDAPDAPALARFYADLLGMEVTYEGPEGALIAGGGKSVMFQQVSGYNS